MKSKLKSDVQVSEFDIATDVITHCPSVETAFPFHLEAFLFYSPPSPSKAARCHQLFCEKMVEMTGCKVWTVREILKQLDIDELRKFVVRNCTIRFTIPPFSNKSSTNDYQSSSSDDDDDDNSKKPVDQSIGRSDSHDPRFENKVISYSHGIGRSYSVHRKKGIIIPTQSSEEPKDKKETEDQEQDSFEKQEKFTIDYVLKSLSELTHDELIDLLLLSPSIEISTGDNVTGFKYDSIPLRPLSNLVFTRDQQIVTDQGVVVGRFTPEQRSPENDIMEFIWSHLGLEPKRIKAPGRLEGGDFIPLGKDISLLGVGFRTNMEGAEQLMEYNWVGTDKLVLVCDVRDFNQERMHLDTIFNVITRNCCICLKQVAKDNPKYMRIAKEYTRKDKGNGKWEYVLTKTMNFGEWLKCNFKYILTCRRHDQNEYLLNFINLGEKDGVMQIIAINPRLKEKVQSIKELDGKVRIEEVDYDGIKAMYGGVHCSTQVFRAPKH